VANAPSLSGHPCKPPRPAQPRVVFPRAPVRPTPLTRKKEITMTKSRHKDTGTDTDADTGTGTDAGTDADTDAGTGAGTGTDADADAGAGAGAGAGAAPLVSSSRAESRLVSSAFLRLSFALGGAAGAAEVPRCEAQMFRFPPGKAWV